MKVIIEGSAEAIRALLKAIEAQPESVRLPVIVEKDIYTKL